MQTQDARNGPMSRPSAPHIPPHVLTKKERLEVGVERAFTLFLHFSNELIELQDAIEGDTDFEPSLSTTTNLCPDDDFVHRNDDREMEETDHNLGGLGDGHSQKDWGGQAGPEGDGYPDLEADGYFIGKGKRRRFVDIPDVEYDCRELEDEGGDLSWSEGESLVGKLTQQTQEYEPSLSAVGGTADAFNPIYTRKAEDQRIWAHGGGQGAAKQGHAWHDAAHARDSEGEVQCEDEGAQCDDEGAIEVDAEHDGAEPDEGDALDMGFDIVQREFMRLQPVANDA